MAGPRKESYMECPTCTQAEGETVLYHRSALKQHEDFWTGEVSWRCPNGHPVTPPPAPAPAPAPANP